MFVFTDVDELRKASPNGEVAVQTGSAAGMWTRSSSTQGQDNTGVVVCDQSGTWWERACDPSQLEARWFGVKADGTHDDAPALQLAIDSLPQAGGVLKLPAGRMRCGSSLRISRSFITIQGVNCGLLSKHFEPGHEIGQGSLLVFDQGIDGLVIEAEHHTLPRLGGVTLREFGIAGVGRDKGQTGIKALSPKGRGWGSTDALLLERLYVIDCQWCAYLKQSDASILNQCWFSECGNGLHLDGCVYTVVSSACIADNDDIGLLVTAGQGNEVVSSVFVRNKQSLVLRDTRSARVNGGVFGTDNAGGERHDQSLILVEGNTDAAVMGASFFVDGQDIQVAIQGDSTSKIAHSACQISGDLERLVD